MLGLLVAQVLWVLGYAALPAFFILYAEDVLGLEAAAASLFLAGFGLVTAAAVLAAGRVQNPRRLRPLLLLGIVLMGGGFLLVSLFAELACRRRARAGRGRLRAHLHGRLPPLRVVHPRGRGRRLHGALLLGPRDRLDDRAARRRLADRGDRELPLALRPRRRSRPSPRSCRSRESAAAPPPARARARFRPPAGSRSGPAALARSRSHSRRRPPRRRRRRSSGSTRSSSSS